MKDLANILGPFAHLHTLWPESILSAAFVGGWKGAGGGATCIMLYYSTISIYWLSLRGAITFDGNVMSITTEMYETFVFGGVTMAWLLMLL